jgi:glutathione synthase/RimK-type ligase-like ATP-grasp enzyme
MPSTTRIGLATTAAARDLDEDYAPFAAALARLGLAAEAPGWDDPNVDWRRYALVLMRSTWNYTEDLSAFLAWAEHVSRVARLLNDTATVRWSTDKRYLLELERHGVPIVPTAIAAPGERWSAPDAAQFVVKPSIGAGSRGARRFRAAEVDAARAHVASLHAAGYATLTQPYLAAVETSGETALMFFEGDYSHAIRKGPLLAAGGAAVEGLFARETIEPRFPAADELGVARRAIGSIPGARPLYARVDLVRDDRGVPRLLELELAEPSLFFTQAPGSADRLAQLVALRLGR